jgi:hypothetical protein
MGSSFLILAQGSGFSHSQLTLRAVQYCHSAIRPGNTPVKTFGKGEACSSKARSGTEQNGEAVRAGRVSVKERLSPAAEKFGKRRTSFLQCAG